MAVSCSQGKVHHHSVELPLKYDNITVFEEEED